MFTVIISFCIKVVRFKQLIVFQIVARRMVETRADVCLNIQTHILLPRSILQFLLKHLTYLRLPSWPYYLWQRLYCQDVWDELWSIWAQRIWVVLHCEEIKTWLEARIAIGHLMASNWRGKFKLDEIYSNRLLQKYNNCPHKHVVWMSMAKCLCGIKGRWYGS